MNMTLEEARKLFDYYYNKGLPIPDEIITVLKQHPPRLPSKRELNPDERRHNKRRWAQVARRDKLGRFSV